MSILNKQEVSNVRPTNFAELRIPKLLILDEICDRRVSLAANGRKVVLTNGCFDLLHAGHIYFLQQARLLGDALFVAINSDESVRALKGPMRPIQSEKERAYALSALECTTAVFIFRQQRLTQEIKSLRPDLYAKAGDYQLETLDAAERLMLMEMGTEIRFLPFLTGMSSTDMIHRVALAGVVGNSPLPPRASPL